MVYVRHMLDIARDAAAKVSGVDREAFDQDDNLQLAVAHLIQMIGEAAARVADDFRRQHPNVPWQTIVGMRHRIVHDYMDVNFDLGWDTATKDLPNLVSELEKFAAG